MFIFMNVYIKISIYTETFLNQIFKDEDDERDWRCVGGLGRLWIWVLEAKDHGEFEDANTKGGGQGAGRGGAGGVLAGDGGEEDEEVAL